MAALHRPTNATYETHENVTIDTQDNEDHTFWYVMSYTVELKYYKFVLCISSRLLCSIPIAIFLIEDVLHFTMPLDVNKKQLAFKLSKFIFADFGIDISIFFPSDI
mmetsp:Transcript_48049/g.51990  ORF Transcript_48049/g.51990 Transcript_48049/m.51990 type:complete len:106 (-) Transcript_48049:284-601(-)